MDIPPLKYVIRSFSQPVSPFEFTSNKLKQSDGERCLIGKIPHKSSFTVHLGEIHIGRATTVLFQHHKSYRRSSNCPECNSKHSHNPK